MSDFNRRDFLSMASVAAAAGVVSGCDTLCAAKGGEGRILFGSCGGPQFTAELKDIGYDFFEWHVAAAAVPDKGEADWKKTKDQILAAALPLRSCNGFLPGSFRLTGPKADFAPALDYAEKACRRLDEVGVKTVVFGSSGARNVPGDYLAKKREDRPDVEKGAEQYAEFCRQLCRRIADLKLAVVIEPLCPNESNIVNYVWQGIQICQDVASPRLQQLADFFHMLKGRESACSIVKAGALLKHCHIAARTRQYPGSGAHDEADLKPFFTALKKIGYTGGVSCECGWPKDKAELRAAREKALALMKKLAAEA